MASVKIILRSNKINKEGLAPLVLQIIHNRKTSEISMKRYLDPKYWDAKGHKVRKSYPSSKSLTVYLNNRRREYEKIIDDLLAQDVEFTIKDVKNIKNGLVSTDLQAIPLVQFLENYIKDNPNNLGWGTLKYYNTALTQAKEFFGDMLLQDVNQHQIEMFRKHLLKEKKSINTIHTRLKVIRKIIKLAIKKGLIKDDPFIHIKLKQEPSNRKYLSKNEFAKLKELSPSTKDKKLILDAFLFSCYTGIRFGDLCILKWDNLISESSQKNSLRIQFKISKTRELLSFRLPTPAVNIINKYKDTGSNEYDYLFPMLKHPNRIKTSEGLLSAISNRNAYYNKVLKEFATEAKISKTISFHIARHTFATLSLSLGISMEVLSKLLGHSDISTTQVYGKIMDKAKDDAMDNWNNL